MWSINKTAYIDAINEYCVRYGKQLLAMIQTTTTYVDKEYARQCITGLDTFCACLRKQCIQDMTMFETDVKCATSLAESYDSFGDYAYDMLVKCFKATNEVLAMNNKLAYDLCKLVDLDKSDFVVTSNYMAINQFSGVAKLELYDFKLSNAGLCYSINIKPTGLNITNIMDDIEHKTQYFIEQSAFLDMLHSEEAIRLLTDWTKVANGPLLRTKLDADLAWHVTYACMKEQIDSMSFCKTVGRAICTLKSKENRFTEFLHRKGINRTVDWGFDRAKMIQLDYLNNMNVCFDTEL